MTQQPPCQEGNQEAQVTIRQPRIQVWAVFFPVLLFYFLMLPPTISRGGDCGELTAVSWGLGIAHPSGYPLYCLAGKLFATVIPFGEIAWRYNLFSALLSALTVSIIAGTTHRLLGPGTRRAMWASMGSAALLAGFYYFGSQGLIAEVYALNGLMLAAMLWCAVAWYQDADWRWFYSLVLLVALGMVTHLSSVFLVPSLFLIAVWARRNRFKNTLGWQQPAAAVLLVAFSTTLLLYFPLRSRLFPEPPKSVPLTRSIYWPLDWGHPVDFQRIKNHATARQYSHLLLKPSAVKVLGRQIHVPLPVLPLSEWGPKIVDWAAFGAVQLLWAFPLLLIGAWTSWRDRTIGAALLLVVILNSVEFGYMVSDVPNFFFPTYIVFGIWLAYGLGTAASWIHNFKPSSQWRFRFCAQAGLLTTIACQWGIFAQTGSWHGHTIVADAAREQALGTERLRAQTGKPPIIVLTSDNFTWAFWYVRYIEGRGGGAVTPWGRALHSLKDGGDLTPDLRAWTKSKPVVLAGLVPSMEHKFYYRSANDSGNLWQISETPEFARPIKINSKPLGTSGLVTAKIRRHSIWRPQSGDTPRILRGGLAALDVQVDAAHLPATGNLNPTYVQVLLAPQKYFESQPDKTPQVHQQTISTGKDFDTEIVVSRQYRQINLPEGTTAGVWGASVPIQIDEYSTVEELDVWARITTAPESTTSWTKVDSLEVVTR